MSDRIAVIEDEPRIASLLADYLKHAGMQPMVFHDGSSALESLKDEPADAILLDLMLPDMDGMEVCREIRRFSTAPVLMVTARVDEVDRLLGLEVGADDYICKPFSPKEVVARVRAALRRARLTFNQNGEDGLSLDENRYEARYRGKAAQLTVVEFGLLRSLLEHPGHIRSRAQLIDSAYNDHRVVSDRTVDSHIRKLRKKLAEAFPGISFIESVYGAGYRYEPKEGEAQDI